MCRTCKKESEEEFCNECKEWIKAGYAIEKCIHCGKEQISLKEGVAINEEGKIIPQIILIDYCEDCINKIIKNNGELNYED